ncbi:MAG: hypothetical protein P8X96_01535 [Desulfobacteraceae bacterium]
MKNSPRGVENLTHAATYLVLAILVVWGGGKVINYAADFGFIRDFLMPWEVRLIELQHRSFKIPPFNRDHPMAYMEDIVSLMKANGMPLPDSNTEHAFVYRLRRVGGETRNILLVFNGRKIKIYGLPDTTFKRLDQYVDGRVDPLGGDFTGRLSKDRITFIGSWKI